MKKSSLSVLLFLLLASLSQAQFTRYIVTFKNKGNSVYSLSNPAAYLSQRSIDRRIKYGIALDSTDLPVTASYIQQVAAISNVTILNASKWLNQLSIQTSDIAAITAINNLPFVKIVSGIAARTINNRQNIEDKVQGIRRSTSSKLATISGDFYDYGANSANEMQVQRGNFLHNIGLRGENMQIAMIDAGFYNYNVYNAFDSINLNSQVLDTWDFVSRNASVAEDHSHGMSCLSTIAANLPGQFVGMAPASSFYLYRSEDAATEYPIEEHYWVCAAERADSAGTDVISSSLGYTTFSNASLDHTYADLDGNTTMAAKGADLAAKKGILVFLAAGNEGTGAWHYIMTPADADSALTVGAVDVNGVKGNFSSFGPTADGRIKPDVVSIGVGAVIETTYNSPGISQGTSYACPKMAGLGTCLWQAFPEYNNMKIIDAIKKSGSAASHPTDSTGYGLPDMKRAFTNLLTEFATSQSVLNDCTVSIGWTSKDVSGMRYEIERKTTTDAEYIKVGEADAQAGSVLSIHSYQFSNTITGSAAGNILYRVRQLVDTSADNFTAAYIDTSSVINPGCDGTGPVEPRDTTINKISVAPNPVYGEIKLIVESTTAIPSLQINIYDIAGRLVLQRKESKGAGKTIYTIPSAHLSKGKYTISVYGSKRLGTVKIIKL